LRCYTSQRQLGRPTRSIFTSRSPATTAATCVIAARIARRHRAVIACAIPSSRYVPSFRRAAAAGSLPAGDVLSLSAAVDRRGTTGGRCVLISVRQQRAGVTGLCADRTRLCRLRGPLRCRQQLQSNQLCVRFTYCYCCWSWILLLLFVSDERCVASNKPRT